MNNNEGSVSIIVPVYNVEKHLRKCLDSIVNQTYKNIEIICVDDGSQDNSIDILREYKAKDNRVKVIRQENKGVSVARNIGLENISGKYLMFVDSDDWIEPNTIEELYNLAEKENSDIIISGLIFENIQENTKIYKIPGSSNWLSKDNLLGSIPNKFHKVEIIKKNNIQFEPNIKMSEDFLFNIEVLSKCKNINVHFTAYYHYILHGLNTVYDLQNRKDIFIVLRKIYEILADDKNRKEIEYIIKVYAKNIFTNLLYAKSFKEFFKYLKVFINYTKKMDYISWFSKLQIYIRALLVCFIYIFHLKNLVILRRKWMIRKKERK